MTQPPLLLWVKFDCLHFCILRVICSSGPELSYWQENCKILSFQHFLPPTFQYFLHRYITWYLSYQWHFTTLPPLHHFINRCFKWHHGTQSCPSEVKIAWEVVGIFCIEALFCVLCSGKCTCDPNCWWPPDVKRTFKGYFFKGLTLKFLVHGNLGIVVKEKNTIWGSNQKLLWKNLDLKKYPQLVTLLANL